jgi:hypothetical protein
MLLLLRLGWRPGVSSSGSCLDGRVPRGVQQGCYCYRSLTTWEGFYGTPDGSGVRFERQSNRGG